MTGTFWGDSSASDCNCFSINNQGGIFIADDRNCIGGPDVS